MSVQVFFPQRIYRSASWVTDMLNLLDFDSFSSREMILAGLFGGEEEEEERGKGNRVGRPKRWEENGKKGVKRRRN